VSFIAPLGTNWMDSHLYTNKMSLNVLGGYSYGNLYFEFGTLYNVNLHYTSGLQIAGLVNWSGKTKNAIQLAGVFNTSMDGNAILQVGHLFNIAKGSTVQFAGLFNFVEKSKLQLSGFNLATDTTTVQLGGVLNVAKESTFQVGGLLNVAEKSTIQLSTLLNVAKEVNGLQLGLINNAEDMNGISIGFISFIKNPTKRELEVGASESFNTFVSYKSGVKRFYNITTVGINYIDKPIIYGIGFGFGTQIDWKEGWANEIELMLCDIFEGRHPLIARLFLKEYESDILYQLKIKTSKQLNDYFKIFFGPVFNFTVSHYKNPNTEKVGSSLSPWSVWKKEGEKTTLNSWIGFEGGVGVCF
jgi:hypothetical protein